MTRNSLFLLFLLSSMTIHAQYFKITGRITNNKLEPLALVSIQVKDETTGTISKEDGTYQLKLEEGKYDIVISMVGYKSQFITLVVSKDYVQNIILESEETKNLTEVIVKGKAKDRSEEIIRNVIRNKETILSAAGAYSCNVYIKATQEDSSQRKIKTKAKIQDTAIKKDADILRMSMTEISLHYDHESNQHIKEERTGVAKRGNPESLFYLSMTEGDFNLYNNLIKVPALSEVPFISPISYSGLSAYKYKVIRTQQEKGRKIYTISIKPTQLSNVTVEGEVTILDSAWVILSATYRFPTYHMPEYDFFEVKQQYQFINDTAWMISQQRLNYYSKTGKGKLSGETIVSYKDFELNKSFPKKYFGTEVSATAQEAYERDSSFWQKTRTEPLTTKEIRYIQYNDSIYRARHNKAYLDSIDKIFNKVTWKKIVLFGQTFYNREKERSWSFSPLTAIYDPFQFGGGRINLSANHFKTYKSKKNIFVNGSISYGLRNHDINGDINFTKLYNPFKRSFYRLSYSRDFDYIFEGDAWLNLLKRSNLYLSEGFGLGHSQELSNGLYLFTDVDISLRRSLSKYETSDRIDSLFPNFLDNNQAVAFDPYNAAYGEIRLEYTPHQQYIREPKQKIILGSKWPTFYVSLRKGLPKLFNSKVDFDYLEFGIKQQLKLGVTGISRYTVKTGSFISQKDLRLVDYKFQREGDPLLFLNPNEAFQSLDSSFPVFRRFYEGHYVHEFNGAILNKIPFLKKLELREIAGGGFLIARERNLRYAELFAGIEKTFKWPFNPLYKFKVGVYVVGSVANQFRNPVQFKFGITSWDRKRNKWL